MAGLYQVVDAFREGKKNIPYRYSVFTHILEDAIGGNCRTTLISCPCFGDKVCFLFSEGLAISPYWRWLKLQNPFSP